MAFSDIINIVLAAGLGWIGLGVRSLYSSIRSLERELSQHKIDSAHTFATRADLIRYESKIDEIRVMLGQKVDRHDR